MKKNIKVYSLLSLCILLFVGIGILFLNFTNTPQIVEPTDTQIEKFNSVLNSVGSKDDIDNCEDIGNEELEESCKAQLKNRFSPLYHADNISICKSDKDVLKQDMCILEVAYSRSKSSDDVALCNEISTQDIKDACFAQINNKNFN